MKNKRLIGDADSFWFEPLVDDKGESQILIKDAERRAANYVAPQDNPLLADANKRAAKWMDR